MAKVALIAALIVAIIAVTGWRRERERRLLAEHAAQINTGVAHGLALLNHAAPLHARVHATSKR